MRDKSEELFCSGFWFLICRQTIPQLSNMCIVLLSKKQFLVEGGIIPTGFMIFLILKSLGFDVQEWYPETKVPMPHRQDEDLSKEVSKPVKSNYFHSKELIFDKICFLKA